MKVEKIFVQKSGVGKLHCPFLLQSHLSHSYITQLRPRARREYFSAREERRFQKRILITISEFLRPSPHSTSLGSGTFSPFPLFSRFISFFRALLKCVFFVKRKLRGGEREGFVFFRLEDLLFCKMLVASSRQQHLFLSLAALVR